MTGGRRPGPLRVRAMAAEAGHGPFRSRWSRDTRAVPRRAGLQRHFTDWTGSECPGYSPAWFDHRHGNGGHTAMDPMSKFIQRENIARFARGLHEDADAPRRDMLRHLLVVEENRLGFYSELLDVANEQLAAGAARIERQK